MLWSKPVVHERRYEQLESHGHRNANEDASDDHTKHVSHDGEHQDADNFAYNTYGKASTNIFANKLAPNGKRYDLDESHGGIPHGKFGPRHTKGRADRDEIHAHHRNDERHDTTGGDAAAACEDEKRVARFWLLDFCISHNESSPLISWSSGMCPKKLVPHLHKRGLHGSGIPNRLSGHDMDDENHGVAIGDEACPDIDSRIFSLCTSPLQSPKRLLVKTRLQSLRLLV